MKATKLVAITVVVGVLLGGAVSATDYRPRRFRIIPPSRAPQVKVRYSRVREPEPWRGERVGWIFGHPGKRVEKTQPKSRDYSPHLIGIHPDPQLDLPNPFAKVIVYRWSPYSSGYLPFKEAMQRMHNPHLSGMHHDPHLNNPSTVIRLDLDPHIDNLRPVRGLDFDPDMSHLGTE